MGAVFVSSFGQEFMAMMRGDVEVVSSCAHPPKWCENHSCNTDRVGALLPVVAFG